MYLHLITCMLYMNIVVVVTLVLSYLKRLHLIACKPTQFDFYLWLKSAEWHEDMEAKAEEGEGRARRETGPKPTRCHRPQMFVYLHLITCMMYMNIVVVALVLTYLNRFDICSSLRAKPTGFEFLLVMEVC